MKKPKPPTKDWLTETNALALAAKIRSYWAPLKVAVWIEQFRTPYKKGNGDAWFMVKSDLVNGLPPVAEEREAA